MIGVTNHAEHEEREGVAPEPDGQEPERHRAHDPAQDGPPIDRAVGWMLLPRRCGGQRVAKRSATTPTPPGRAEDQGQRLHDGGVTGCGRDGGRVDGRGHARPASASSTRVACDTPVAPRAANGMALR